MAWYRCGTGIPPYVKNLKTVSSDSGSIATFDTDLTDNIVKCVAEIKPSTSGYTSVKVNRTGINLYDMTVGRRFTGILIPAGSHIYMYSQYNQSVHTFFIGFSDGTTTSFNIPTFETYDYVPAKDVTVIASSETAYKWCVANNGIIQYSLINFTTPTLYTGTSVTIALGETLTQGGSLDVLSGVLTRTDTTTKQVTSNQISQLLGLNNIFVDTGNINVEFLETVGHKIS